MTALQFWGRSQPTAVGRRPIMGHTPQRAPPFLPPSYHPLFPSPSARPQSPAVPAAFPPCPFTITPAAGVRRLRDARRGQPYPVLRSAFSFTAGALPPTRGTGGGGSGRGPKEGIPSWVPYETSTAARLSQEGPKTRNPVATIKFCFIRTRSIRNCPNSKDCLPCFDRK